MIYIVIASFMDPVTLQNKGISFDFSKWSLDAYQRVVSDKQIWVGFKNAILYSIIFTIISVAVTMLAAYPMSLPDFKGKAIFNTLFVITMFFSGGLIPTYLLINNLGLLDSMWAVILPGAFSVWNMIIARTYYQGIPRELREAADVDGASEMLYFFKILLPVCMPVVAVLALWQFVAMWNSYFDAMIYAYTTPEIARHNGWTKIGYTEQSVDKRLKQQTHTADVLFHEEWRGNAVYDDGSGEVFTDHDFHAYLRKLNVENDRKNEWFRLDGEQSRRYFQDFRMNRGRVKLDAAIPYTLRKEQAEAVAQTKAYCQNHPGGEFLWNAKPRFGKTLSVYDFCKQVDAQTVLIVTNRPAIANSWYSDYVRFLGRESGYLFVSHVDALAGQPHVLDEQGYLDAAAQGEELYKRIEFVSLQDMKGSRYFGGEYDKLRHLTELNWDVLVIDEAHEGVDTYKTDLAFDRIHRRFTLHLSGTPFKALANDKFAGDAIFNWTYADEQAAKRSWQGAPGQQNPYANLPMLNLYTYQMSEIIRDEIQQGVEIDGETQEFAFDLNEFFKVKPSGSFEHDAEVDRFLDAMTTQNKFPFSTPELRAELKHTFWLLNRVDSARALAKKLQAHPVFRDYEVILAAGDGKLDDTDENQKSFDRVKAAIAHHEKTITLSVGQLTTGVTIPEWSAVLMLSNLKSPALYMQAAFRAQNPCLFHENDTFRRPENA